MDAANESELSEKPRPTPSVQTGRPKLTGGVWISVAFAALLGALVVNIDFARPRVSVLISALLWVAMSVYWSRAENKRRDSKARESVESRQVHGLLTNAAIFSLFLPIPGLTGRFLPDTLTTACVGLGIQVAFNAFYLYARFYLGKLWSGAITIMTDHELIQTGPYRFLRHPMYTGMLGMAVGTAVVSGQYHALLGVALFVLAYVRKIRMEERVLATEFGEPYSIYRRRTAALIPWVL